MASYASAAYGSAAYAGVGSGSPATTDGLYVQVGFTSNPATAQASIAWTDITTDLLVADGVTVQRGRSSELDTFQAGSASFTLKNAARTYDPTYTAGTHYGNLLPLRPVRIFYVQSGVTRPLFTGFVTAWPQAYDYPHWSKVKIVCVDGFHLLEQAVIESGYFLLDSAFNGVLDKSRLGLGTFTAQLAGARVGAILDLAGYPTADRTIDTGVAMIEAAQASGSALSQLQSVADGEVGQMFMGPAGTVVFEDRHHRITRTASTTSQATFGDAGTEIPYSDITFDYSEKLIKNDVTRTDTANTATAGTAQDATSIATYFRRTDSKSVPVSAAADLVAQAQAVVNRYKDPQLRVESLMFRNAYPGTTAFSALVSLRISDRVTVKRRPQSVGAVISQDCWVEGITAERHAVNDWTWKLLLSPVDTPSWLILDSASLGKLNTGQLAA